MESPERTVIKAVMWNLVGLVSMSVVGIVVTGSAALGGSLAIANTVVGFVCYVLYERLWARISWGRRTIRTH